MTRLADPTTSWLLISVDNSICRHAGFELPIQIGDSDNHTVDRAFAAVHGLHVAWRKFSFIRDVDQSAFESFTGVRNIFSGLILCLFILSQCFTIGKNIVSRSAIIANAVIWSGIAKIRFPIVSIEPVGSRTH